MPGTHCTCEVCGVKEKHGREKRFFANFQLDKNRCREWVKLVGKEDLAYLPIYKLNTLRHICEAHFSKRDFSKTKKQLKKRAVPKCNLTMAPLSDDILAEFIQINSDDVTPRKKKLLKQLRKTKCTLASLKRSAKLIENLSSPVSKEFVLSALKNKKRKPQGKQWTTKNKISALAIFKRSPKAYRYLQHIMPLPSVKLSKTYLKKFQWNPESTEQSFTT